jgi:hypothetical protein
MAHRGALVREKGKMNMPEQIPQAIPETFLLADREAAKVGLNPLQLAYIERLENAVKAGDNFWTIMQMCVMSPQQFALSEALLEANSTINFVSERDFVEVAACHEDEASELRHIIFK